MKNQNPVEIKKIIIVIDFPKLYFKLSRSRPQGLFQTGYLLPVEEHDGM